MLKINKSIHNLIKSDWQSDQYTRRVPLFSRPSRAHAHARPGARRQTGVVSTQQMSSDLDGRDILADQSRRRGEAECGPAEKYELSVVFPPDKLLSNEAVLARKRSSIS